MVELTQAFVTALTAAGIHAVAARPAAVSPRLKRCAVAVGVDKLERTPGGLGAYLGHLIDTHADGRDQDRFRAH